MKCELPLLTAVWHKKLLRIVDACQVEVFRFRSQRIFSGKAMQCYDGAPVSSTLPSTSSAPMFDFLFKRKSAKSTQTQQPQAGHAKGNASHTDKAQEAAAKASQDQAAAQRLVQQEKKQAALQQAASFAGNETAAVAFILQSEFADARLQAAEHVISKLGLEQILAAMRNTDRRVAKLAQQRLEALHYQQQMHGRAATCLAQAEKMLADAQLMPNQLSVLDRDWLAVGKLPADAPQAVQFAQLREQLAQRLQAQAGWQRRLIDLTSQIKQLLSQLQAEATADFATVRQQAQEFAQQLQEIQASNEAAALPRHLMPQAQAEYQQLAQVLVVLEQAEQAQVACEQALSQWQALPQVDAAGLSQIAREWQGLLKACASGQQPALQERFAAWQRAVIAAMPVQKTPPAARDGENSEHSEHSAIAPAASGDLAEAGAATAEPVARHESRASAHRVQLSAPEMKAAKQQFSAALDALEAALQEGLLQAAFEHDKTLRDLKAVRPAAEQSSRMTALRAELHRLQSWARWGGKVSREELTKSVEELASQQLSVVELAKKVGSMRERWRSLDATAGPAARQLWERFDAACTTAYAPAAEHFKKLAQERAHHAEQAQVLVQEVQAFAASHITGLSNEQIDWRALAGFCQRAEQQWHKLGTIERKERKRLDKEFAQAMQVLTQPLEGQRSVEVAKREVLIAAVQELQAHERGALDHLRQLQERWQELAKALPLARKVEQQLWQRFHSGCEQVFAQRKENAHHEQQERRQHLQAKEAICAQLEQLAGDESNEARNQLRDAVKEAKHAWREIGQVPRNQEQVLEARFHAAQEAVQKRLDMAARLQQQAQTQAVLEKLALCQQLESALQQDGAALDVSAWQERWQALPKLSQEMEKILGTRWQQALAAASDDNLRQALCVQLAKNLPQLLNEVLRLEIVHGLESPAEFSRERLKMQVQVLQSSLKSGEKQAGQGKAMLLGLVAGVDEVLAKRMLAVLAQ